MYNRQRRVPSSGRFTTEMSMTSKFCVDGRTLDPAPQSPGPHIAEVPNWGKILLYWLFRSKIWYFRVIWLFTAKFFKKLVFFYAFWRAAVKNQNKTIRLDFCQIRSYLAVLGTVGHYSHPNFQIVKIEINFWEGATQLF